MTTSSKTLRWCHKHLNNHVFGAEDLHVLGRLNELRHQFLNEDHLSPLPRHPLS